MTPEGVAFVLVHGAFHGGWCWRRVAQRLRAVGAQVWTPTLTGLGERAHLLSPAVNLTTFVEDVVRLIEWEELSRVVLVGHSFGGLVASGVAERRPDRLAHLVLLDGLVAGDGQCALDLLDPETALDRRRAAEAAACVATPPPDPEVFGVVDADDLAWLRRRLTPQPFAALSEPLRLRTPTAAIAPCSYIRCVRPAYRAMRTSHRRVEGRPGWRVYDLAACHDAMITEPGAVADLLLQIAREP